MRAPRPRNRVSPRPRSGVSLYWQRRGRRRTSVSVGVLGPSRDCHCAAVAGPSDRQSAGDGDHDRGDAFRQGNTGRDLLRARHVLVHRCSGLLFPGARLTDVRNPPAKCVLAVAGVDGRGHSTIRSSVTLTRRCSQPGYGQRNSSATVTARPRALSLRIGYRVKPVQGWCMATVFISHAEEDQALALDIARGLEQAGYSTWYYERDSSPGLSYDFRSTAPSRRVKSSFSSSPHERSAPTRSPPRSFAPTRPVSASCPCARGSRTSSSNGASPSGTWPSARPGRSPSRQTEWRRSCRQIIEGLGLLSAEREGRGAAPARVPAETPPRPTRTWAAAGAIALALVLLALYGCPWRVDVART